jgi:16S rRNA G966 N2-methylase RsmD
MSITEHFIEAINQTNQLVIDNGCNNVAICSDAMLVEKKVDLVYLDPPYF